MSLHTQLSIRLSHVRATMGRVYVAAPLFCRSEAQEVARCLVLRRTARVVSTWHDNPESTIEKERVLSPEGAKQLIETCFQEIDIADALVLVLPANLKGRLGAIIETGYAIGKGKPVFVLRNEFPRRLDRDREEEVEIPFLLRSRCEDAGTLSDFFAERAGP